MKLLSLDNSDNVGLSLQMLAVGTILKTVISSLESRSLKASRQVLFVARYWFPLHYSKSSQYLPVFVNRFVQYQLLSEIRMIVAFTIEIAHSDLTPRERSSVSTNSFEAFALVNSLLRETSQDKKHESRLRASIDQEGKTATLSISLICLNKRFGGDGQNTGRERTSAFIVPSGTVLVQAKRS